MSASHPPLSGDWAAGFLAGRRVFVTGGTSGIGQGIALGFAQAGAHVTASGVTDREVETATGWAAGLDLPGSLGFCRLDVRDGDDVAATIGAQADLYALVNCAGIIRRGEELSPEVFDQVTDINLNGTMRCCHAAQPALARSGGAIVNTASMLSFFGGGLVPGYAASKGGIAQLTKSLAIAWAGDGIRVNAIAPGWISTPLTTALQADEGRSGAILGRTPLGRWGTPADLAGLVLFLCTPLAGFMTGTVIPVDGGYAIA